ncbi:unnamed protein product [Penicillium viridicatum]
MAKNIVVIGAGVAGLTTAVLLSKKSGYNIGLYQRTDAAEWDKNTWGPLENLAINHPGAEREIHNRAKDVGSATANWFKELLSSNPWFAKVVPNFRSLPKEALDPGIDSATVFTSVFINTAIYLPWLVSQCLSNGVIFKRGGFDNILDAAASGIHPNGRVDLVVNCTGLMASKLGRVQDTSVVPARGQIVIVRNDTGKMLDMSGTDDGDEEACYVMTRAAGGGTILGGSYQKGNWESQPDPNLAIRIVKRAVKMWPGLTNGKRIEHLDIIRHGVGLTCSRRRHTNRKGPYWWSVGGS